MFAVCQAVRTWPHCPVENRTAWRRDATACPECRSQCRAGKTLAAGLTGDAGSIQDLAEEAGRYALPW